MPTKKISIYMDDDQREKLRFCASQFHLSMNAYVGMLVELNYKALNSRSITEAAQKAHDEDSTKVYGALGWSVADMEK